MHQISFRFFQRGVNPEREITRIRKKRVSHIFPWGIHIWNFKTLACTVLEWTDGQTETNMLSQLLRSWGINRSKQHRSATLEKCWWVQFKLFYNAIFNTGSDAVRIETRCNRPEFPPSQFFSPGKNRAGPFFPQRKNWLVSFFPTQSVFSPLIFFL